MSTRLHRRPGSLARVRPISSAGPAPRSDWWRDRLADGLARDLAREIETILIASGGADHARHAPTPALFAWLNEGVLRDLEQVRELTERVQGDGRPYGGSASRIPPVHDALDLLDQLIEAGDRATADYLDRAIVAERCHDRELADRLAAMAEEERIHAGRGRALRGRLLEAA